MRMPTRMRTRSKRTMLMAALLGGCPSAVLAVDFNWNGGSGDFNDPLKWTETDPVESGFPNDADDHAVFNTGGAAGYTVTAPTGTTTFGALTVNDPSVTLDLVATGRDLRFSGALTVGSTAAGGAKLVLTSSAPSGVKGILQASGTPTVNIGVGDNTVGAVEVRNGARFSRSGSGDPAVGSGAGARGAILVDGAGSGMTLSGSSVRFSLGGGEADVTIQNGGLLTTDGHVYLAQTGAGDADILIDNATWNHTHAARFINFGSNGTTQGAANITLTVQNGGTLSSASSIQLSDGTPDRNFGKTVLETVTGTNSLATSVSRGVGGGQVAAIDSDHDLIVSDGGTVRVRQGFFVWNAVNFGGGPAGDRGTVTLDDGSIELGGAATAGTLTLHGELRGAGVVRRTAGATEPLTLSVGATGVVRPGDTSGTPAVGTLTVRDGVFDLNADGDLFLDVVSPTGFDKLVVEDTLNDGVATADLGGNLVYALDGSFAAPAAGGFLDFVIAEDVIYAPTSDNLAALLAGLGYTQGAGPSQFQYGVVTVGAADYAGGRYSGYEALRLSFSAAPIPEPASAMALGLGSVLVLRRRRGE